MYCISLIKIYLYHDSHLRGWTQKCNRIQGSQNVPATDDFTGKKFIEHGFSNNFYVYVNCRYRVLLIYILLSITFTIAINRTLTNPPSSKYIQLLVTSRWELRTSTTQHFGLHLVLLYRCAKRSEWIVCSWRIRSRHIPKLGYPFTECKNKQGNRWRFNGFSVI